MKSVNIYLLLLLCFVFAGSSWGQVPVFTGTKINQVSAEEKLAASFTACSIYQIDAEALHQHLKESAAKKSFTLNLADEYSFDLELESVVITRPNSMLTVITENGEEKSPFYFDKAYKGKLNSENPTSDVRLVIDERTISGYIDNGKNTFYFEPYRRYSQTNEADWFVFYNAENTIIDPGTRCGVVDVVEEQQKAKPVPPVVEGLPKSESSMACIEVELSIGADFSIYQQEGSSVGDLLTRIISTINNVNGNYDNEFNDEIRFVIVNFIASTCAACDPWDSTVNADDLLDDFEDWGEDGGFCDGTTDLHGLWTSRNLEADDGSTGVAGIATRGSVCDSDGYHVIEDINRPASQLRLINTHEIGHNFNCPHNYAIGSDCDPPGRPTTYIMDPFVSTSNTWSTGGDVCDENSTQTVNDYYPGRSCLTACTTAPTDVWVDFNYGGCVQRGTFLEPFSLITMGIYWVAPQGTISIKTSGSTSETPDIEKPLTIEAFDGPATIGQ